MAMIPLRPRVEPLDEDEQEELEERLMNSGGDITSFSELDGFYAALLVAPVGMLPNEWFGRVINYSENDEWPRADDEPTPEYHGETIQLLLRHWHDLQHRLDTGQFQNVPLPREELELPGEWWSQGFLLLARCPEEEWEDWYRAFQEEGLLAPMHELAWEARREPEQRLITGELRRLVLKRLIECVNVMYQRAEAHRRTAGA